MADYMRDGGGTQLQPLLHVKLHNEGGDGDSELSDNSSGTRDIHDDRASRHSNHTHYSTSTSTPAHKYSELEFEEALKLLKMGRHQIYQYILLSLTGFIGSLHMLSAVFLCATPKHRCNIPELDINHTYTDVSVYPHAHDIIPYDDGIGDYSRCYMFDTSGLMLGANSTWSQLMYKHISNNESGGSVRERVECTSGYLYDTSTYTTTVVTQWQLVCDTSWLRSLSESLFMAGVLVGAGVFGVTSDKYGRKLTLCLSLVLQFTFGILSALMPSVETFCVSRFIEGMAISGVYLTAFVMGNEMVLPHMRTYFGVLFHLPGTFGSMILGALAYYIRNWRLLEIALTLPGAYMLFYYWLVDESVRWLMSNGKHKEAERIFRKAAKTNKVHLPEEFSLKVHTCETAQANMLDLVRTRNLRKNAIIIFYSWFVSSLVFYAIQLNIEGLPGDDYSNYEISILVELLTLPICLYCMSRVGRRPTQLVAMLCAATSCAMLGCIPADYTSSIVTLAMLGKVCVSITFTTAYQYSVEAFPTVTRNAGIGASSMCARIGGILAPFVILMEQSSRWIPYIFLASTALLAAFLTYYLPETRGKHLPETLEEGESFGLDQKRWTVTSCFTNRRRQGEEDSASADVIRRISMNDIVGSSSSSSSDNEGEIAGDEETIYVKTDA